MATAVVHLPVVGSISQTQGLIRQFCVNHFLSSIIYITQHFLHCNIPIGVMLRSSLVPLLLPCGNKKQAASAMADCFEVVKKVKIRAISYCSCWKTVRTLFLVRDKGLEPLRSPART